MQLNPNAKEFFPSAQTLAAISATAQMETKVSKEYFGKMGFLNNPKNGPPIESIMSYEGCYVPIQITIVESPEEFYIQKKDMLEDLYSLCRNMSAWYEDFDEEFKERPVKFKNIVVGGFYAGKPTILPETLLSKPKWVRVKVCEKPKDPSLPLQNGVYCSLIDFGGIQFFECSKLRPLRCCDAKLPWVSAMAQLCTLDTNSEGFKNSKIRPKRFNQMVEVAAKHNQNLLAFILNEELKDGLYRLPFPKWEIFITAQNRNYNFMAMELAEPLKMIKLK